jgi:hypothetical protein
VVLGGVVVLGAREVEADDAAALVGDGELGHLERRLRRDVADAADDHVGLDAPVLAVRLARRPASTASTTR